MPSDSEIMLERCAWGKLRFEEVLQVRLYAYQLEAAWHTWLLKEST